MCTNACFKSRWEPPPCRLPALECSTKRRQPRIGVKKELSIEPSGNHRQHLAARVSRADRKSLTLHPRVVSASACLLEFSCTPLETAGAKAMATGVDSPGTDAPYAGSLLITVTICNRTSSWFSPRKPRALAVSLPTKGRKQRRTGDHDEDSNVDGGLARRGSTRTCVGKV